MRKIFIWFPQGRLGNLIFQYQAICQLSGRELVLALDSEFFDMFERPRRFLVFPCFKRLRQRLQPLWTAILHALMARKWIGTIEPERRPVLDHFTCESADVRRTKGFIQSILAVKGFFHTARYAEPLPRLKQSVLLNAERRLAAVPKPLRVAVHMRLGDYRQWPVFGVPGAACLPHTYYADALATIKSKVPDAYFYVLSDEPADARAVLDSAGASDRMEIVDDGTPESDFALIASCSHAVISASSYSWWAATLIANPDRILIAPKYWIGFRRKTWYPTEIQSSHFVYVDPIPD